ncbi:hypothetical protein K466DRAFT_505861, partial [Polyporus arcularius HHB13444]
ADYCLVAASVLFIYDTFLTFDQEVAYFWTTKRISGAALLFFANKWISMMVYVMSLVGFASFPSDKVSSLNDCKMIVDFCSCSLFVIAAHAMSILQFIPGAAFSALRAYVLSRSKPLGIVVAALSLAPVGANLVDYGYQYSGENFPPFGCVVTDNTTAALDLRGLHCLMSFSVVVCLSKQIPLAYRCLTPLLRNHIFCVCPVPKVSKVSEQLIKLNAGISILFIMNILHLVFSATAVSIDLGGSFSLITQFTAPITAILISRFLLELQEANHTVVKLDADDPLHSSRNPWDSTPSFVSSLGGFINPSRSVQSNDDGNIELQDRSPSEAPGEGEGEVPAEVVPEATASSSSTV